MKKLSEFNDITFYFFDEPRIDKKIAEKFSGDSKRAHEIIDNFIEVYKNIPTEKWNVADLDIISHEKLAEFSYKPKEAFMTIRYVTTGCDSTPPLFDVLGLLGKEETLKRLKKF